MSALPSLCAVCAHLAPTLSPTCAAYPDGIPARFWTYNADHRQRVGDEATPVTFTPADDARPGDVALILANLGEAPGPDTLPEVV